jgi:hypothetical protein
VTPVWRDEGIGELRIQNREVRIKNLKLGMGYQRRRMVMR